MFPSVVWNDNGDFSIVFNPEIPNGIVKTSYFKNFKNFHFSLNSYFSQILTFDSFKDRTSDNIFKNKTHKETLFIIKTKI